MVIVTDDFHSQSHWDSLTGDQSSPCQHRLAPSSVPLALLVPHLLGAGGQGRAAGRGDGREAGTRCGCKCCASHPGAAPSWAGTRGRTLPSWSPHFPLPCGWLTSAFCKGHSPCLPFSLPFQSALRFTFLSLLGPQCRRCNPHVRSVPPSTAHSSLPAAQDMLLLLSPQFPAEISTHTQPPPGLLVPSPTLRSLLGL